MNRYVERRTHPARAPTCASDRRAPSREWLEQAQGIGASYGNASEELIYSCVRAGKRQSTAKTCNHEVPRSTTVSAWSLLARLTATLKNDAQALRFLRNTPAENGVPAHVLAVTFRAAQPMPLSFASLQVEVFRQGFGHASEIYATMLKEHPDFKLDTQSLEAWGYRLLTDRHFAEAFEIMKLEVQTDPSSSAYFALGEAYRESGQPEQAVQSYREVLARDPSNAGAKQRLSEYGRLPSN